MSVCVCDMCAYIYIYIYIYYGVIVFLLLPPCEGGLLLTDTTTSWACNGNERVVISHRIFNRRKITMVNGMHTTLAFLTLCRKETGGNNIHA